MTEEEAKAWRERRLDIAQAAHENHAKWLQIQFQSVITFSTEALKAAALINGTAAAAALALVSQAIGRSPALAVALVPSIKSFAFGLLSAVIAAGLAYLAQMCFAAHWGAHELHYQSPHIRETPKAAAWKDAGIVLQVLSILLIVGAYGGALYGFYSAGSVLEKAIP